MFSPTSPPRSDHPFEMMALTPAARTASTIVASILAGSSRTMLPNPMYTGGGPALRKFARSDGGVYLGVSRKKKPHTSVTNVSM